MQHRRLDELLFEAEDLLRTIHDGVLGKRLLFGIDDLLDRTRAEVEGRFFAVEDVVLFVVRQRLEAVVVVGLGALGGWLFCVEIVLVFVGIIKTQP